MRHPNDFKIFEGDIADHNAVADNSDHNNDWKEAFEFISNNDHVHYDDSKQNYYTANPTLTQGTKTCVNICRASIRASLTLLLQSNLMGCGKRKKNKEKEAFFLELEERSMNKNKKPWLLVIVFFHYNFVSLCGL